MMKIIADRILKYKTWLTLFPLGCIGCRVHLNLVSCKRISLLTK